MIGFYTLFYKEILRFWKVAFQTILSPVLTTLLYLIIFGHALGSRIETFNGISYISFLVPGLVMMNMLQNAFSNSSSSLIQSKLTGNLVFILLPPLGHWEMFVSYVLASVVRGLAIGLAVFMATIWFVSTPIAAPLYIILFAILGSTIMASLGMIAGIWTEKFDQLAAFQNFLIMPLTFLAGVFYSTHHLPENARIASHFNPFFYMVDGFRYGFFGVSDVSPVISLSIVTAFCLIIVAINIRLLITGYKLRH